MKELHINWKQRKRKKEEKKNARVNFSRKKNEIAH